MVIRNLEIALWHLRDPELRVPMWIDAVCIGQPNVAERSHQVAYMCEIYRKAGETYGWVGPNADDSDEAMEWIYLFLGCVDVNWGIETMNIPDQLVNTKYRAMADASVPWEFEWPWPLLQLCHFTNREYFTRLWVRQEVKLSRCKDLFSTFARWIAAKPYTCVDEWGLWTNELAARYKAGSNLNLRRGLPNLDRFRFDNSKLKWKDPRNAIYANLGLLAPEYRQLGIGPDYGKDPAAIFTDVTVRVTTKLHSLDFLESCDCFAIYLDGLPTWVPDWSSPLMQEAGMKNIWSSSAWISAQVEYLGDGVMVANVVAVSAVEEVHNWEGKRPYEGEPYMVCDCIRQWCDLKRADYDEHQEQYLEGGNRTWLEAWCTLFLYGNLSDVFEAGQESKVDRPGLWTLQEAKELRMEKFLSKISDKMKARVVFKTADQHIRVAPSSVIASETVSVLLGRPVPVILEPIWIDNSLVDESEADEPDCFVVGLMDGEAITGPLPRNCRTVD
ncbi:putative heterokaryon incompatibility protein [Triangularia setosa]|uniref:Heterokaryon incompatibility protein n=1 Tax=Triangularia setosa TaxID=2587417 RepID=A0AAN6W7P8_9PEZI|nr:putative heterokaryon incompatibility protein [Podospora setosa]